MKQRRVICYKNTEPLLFIETKLLVEDITISLNIVDIEMENINQFTLGTEMKKGTDLKNA